MSAGSVNRVILVGNLGADPEIRTFSDGNAVANLRLATTEAWRDKTTGERKEKTEWHRVVVKNPGLVKVVEQYCRKGMKVYIEGQIQSRKYTQDGVEKFSTEIVLSPFGGVLTMLDKGGEGEREDAPPAGQNRYAAASGAGPRGREDLNDDIPF